MNRGTRIALKTAAAALLTGATLAISPPFIASAIGGDAAQRHHKEAHLAATTEVLAALEGQMSGSNTGVISLTQVRQELIGLYNCEVQIGCLSGRGGGAGQASRAVQQILQSFSAAQDGAVGNVDDQRALLVQAQVQIELARQAIRSNDDEAFSEAASIAHSALSRVQPSADAAVIDTSVLSNSTYPQIAALGRRLSEDGNNPQIALPKAVPTYVPMDDYEATVAYADKVYTAHLLAIAVECLPFVMFLLLLLSAQLRKSEEDETLQHKEETSGDTLIPFSGRHPAE